MIQLPNFLAIELPQKKIIEFCQRWNIEQFYLFGSVLRKDFNSQSDIDVMIEFVPNHSWGLEIIDMNEELEDIFNRPVDLLTKNSVENSENWIRRRNILSSAILIYERK